MAGIANIIYGADFSNSPLGKVTLKQSTEETASTIVNAYTTAIGDDTYSTQLTKMVSDLISLGEWNDLDIYPILGNTVNRLCVNLNPNNGYTKAPIVILEDGLPQVGADNKSIQLTRHTTYGNSAETTLPSTLVTRDEIYETDTDISGMYAFVDFYRTSDSTMAFFYHKRATGHIGTILRVPATNTNDGAPQFKLGANSVTSTPENTIACTTDFPFLKNERRRLEVIADGATLDLYVNEVKATPNGATNTYHYDTTKTFTRNNSFCHCAGGNALFYVQGNIDPTHFDAVNTIFKTFLDAVKPNE